MTRVTTVLVLVLAGSGAALAAQHEELPEYTGRGFQDLYEYAIANVLPNLEVPEERYEVTGDEEVDDRIWEAALARGYRLQPVAGGDLASVDGVPMQPQAAEAWRSLGQEARSAGMRFVVSSAYRSPASQRAQFLSKLEGTTDVAIDSALRWYSIPGTSKHHGGYALDFRYANGTFGEFRSTRDYAWLAADNFAVPKRHGLIPSYPDDVEEQGPNPEPWEFVWVGVGLIQCGLPQDLGLTVRGPEAALVADIEGCPGGMDPAAVPDWLA